MNYAELVKRHTEIAKGARGDRRLAMDTKGQMELLFASIEAAHAILTKPSLTADERCHDATAYLSRCIQSITT